MFLLAESMQPLSDWVISLMVWLPVWLKVWLGRFWVWLSTVPFMLQVYWLMFPSGIVLASLIEKLLPFMHCWLLLMVKSTMGRGLM